MVTWTFDLVTLSIGIMIGIVIGGGIALYGLLRDGGLWSIGFMEGAEFKQQHGDVNNQKEEDMK